MAHVSDEDVVLTLHRYFTWTDWMWRRFHHLVKTRGTDPESLSLDGFLYMSHWLAALSVVVEGWKAERNLGNHYLKDPEVNGLLGGSTHQLRKYRDAVYHFKRAYFDKQYKDFLAGTDGLPWAVKLHDAFKRFFRDFLKTHPVG